VGDPNAAAMLADPAPPLATPPEPKFFVPEEAPAAT